MQNVRLVWLNTILSQAPARHLTLNTQVSTSETRQTFETQPENSRHISRLGQFFVKVDLDLPHSYFRRTTDKGPQSLQRLFRYHKLEH